MKQPQKRAQILLAVALLLYACGYVTQFIGNYAVWQKNGGMLGGTSPPFPSLSPLTCLKGVLWFPYNLYCMAGCAAAVAVIFLYRKLFCQDALTDSERNFDFSAKGTYGTSGWMQTREVPAVLDMVSDLSQHTGTVLGMLDGKFLCIPVKTRMNGNLAVYGASGSMKTRSFCMNRILQSAARACTRTCSATWTACCWSSVPMAARSSPSIPTNKPCRTCHHRPGPGAAARRYQDRGRDRIARRHGPWPGQ